MLILLNMNKVVVYTLVILSFLNFYAFDTIMLSCPGETQIHEVLESQN